jgi:hypothetical protein
MQLNNTPISRAYAVAWRSALNGNNPWVFFCDEESDFLPLFFPTRSEAYEFCLDLSLPRMTEKKVVAVDFIGQDC